MKLKLYRDKVISIVKGKDRVGIYIKFNKDYLFDNYDDERYIPKGTEIVLAEMSPEKADKILKLWNNK